MKKIFILIILIITVLLLNPINVGGASNSNNNYDGPSQKYSTTYSDSYYSSIVGKKGDALLEGLAALSITEHDYYTNYGELRGALSVSDAGSSGTVVDIYSGFELDNEWLGKSPGWNREHVWCQANSGNLFKDTANTDKGAGADVHHIRSIAWGFNSTRSNNKFVDFSDITSETPKTAYSDGVATDCLVSASYFEPRDAVKGDVARILMYLYMHYSSEVSANTVSTYAYDGALSITNIVYTEKKTAQAAWDLLCKWNKLDPVDATETKRHNYCVSVTGVRNPFIDHSEFADIIWNTSYSGSGAMLDSGDNTDTPVTVDYNKLLNEYKNNNVYTKKSNIYLTNKTAEELDQYFHGEVAKDRTTYYNGEYLLMANLDGSIASVDSNNNPVDGINSGYYTSGNNVKHFVYSGGSVVDTYTVENTTLHDMYVTMEKLGSGSYLSSKWGNGTYNVTTTNDKYLADFLAFTAPCLTDYVFSSNYLTQTGIKLEIAEEENSYSEYLALRIYASSGDSGKVGSNLLLSEARIYKGNVKIDESTFNTVTPETPSVPDSGGSSSGGSSSGSSSTPSNKYTYTFTSSVYSKEETISLGDRNWQLSYTVAKTSDAYFGYSSTKGHQFGKAAMPFSQMNLTVTTNFNNISQIEIETSGANGTTATLKVYVGSGNLIGERTLTSSNAKYVFRPGGDSGRVSFKFYQTASTGKAIYIKRITVHMNA